MDGLPVVALDLVLAEKRHRGVTVFVIGEKFDLYPSAKTWRQRPDLADHPILAFVAVVLFGVDHIRVEIFLPHGRRAVRDRVR